MSLGNVTPIVGGWWFYLGWFLPAGLLYLEIAIDQGETKTVTGTGQSQTGESITIYTQVPTGRTIEGDPDIGRFVAALWMTCFPIGWLYLPVWVNGFEIYGTGFPNLDWTLVKVIFPLSVVIVIGFVIKTVIGSDNWFCKLLVGIWWLAIGAGVFSASAPIVAELMEWLFSRA